MHRYTGLLYQVSDHRLGTVLAQLFIHLGFATCIGEAHDLYEISAKWDGGLRQLPELFLIVR